MVGLGQGLGRLNLILFGAAVLAATYLLTDTITNRQPKAWVVDPAAALQRQRAGPGRPTVYLLIVDSLRYETAIDPAIMPSLCALAREGVHAKVKPGFNAVTGPAIRDMFTGRENTSVLAFVANFLHVDAGVESIFNQMAAEGIQCSAYSMGFFRQFGRAIAHEEDIPSRSSRDDDEANVLKGVEDLREGRDEFVVGHLNYTDYAAHDFGIHAPDYQVAFSRADALIGVIRSRLPPGTTFAVTGDHGHDERGRHGYGMDVPTYAVYCGPMFRRDFDLGTITNISHRYLLSQAMGITVRSEDYAGQYLPQALNISRNRLESLFAQARLAPPESTRPWALWIYTSFIGILWLNLVMAGTSPVDFSRGKALFLWLGFIPYFSWGSLQPLSMLGAAVVLSVLLLRRLSARQAQLWVGLPVAAALAAHGWGRLLATARPWLAALQPWEIAAFWTIAALAGSAAASRSRRPWVTGALLGSAALLFFPSEEPFGFPCVMVPALFCWFLLYAASVIRCGASRRDVARLGIAGAALFLFLQPFASTVADAGFFVAWRPLIPALSSTNIAWMLAVATIAKLIIFFPKRPGAVEAACSCGLIVMLAYFETRAWVPYRTIWVEIMAALLLVWRVGRRYGRPEARGFGLAFWFLMVVCLIVPNRPNYLDTTCMIGAAVVCARVVRAFPQRENAAFDTAVLALFGLMVTGWAFCFWSVTHLEWVAAFSWLSEPEIERYVYVFAAWVALKSLVPWVIIVGLLRRELRGVTTFPANAVFVSFSVKVLSASMINMGLGGADTLNRFYLEGAGVGAVLAILFLGPFLMRDSWPKAPLGPQAA
jgi:hypothetical protein